MSILDVRCRERAGTTFVVESPHYRDMLALWLDSERISKTGFNAQITLTPGMNPITATPNPDRLGDCALRGIAVGLRCSPSAR